MGPSTAAVGCLVAECVRLDDVQDGVVPTLGLAQIGHRDQYLEPVLPLANLGNFLLQLNVRRRGTERLLLIAHESVAEGLFPQVEHDLAPVLYYL